MKLNRLIKEEERVIVNKGTEMPFSGEYEHKTNERVTDNSLGVL